MNKPTIHEMLTEVFQFAADGTPYSRAVLFIGAGPNDNGPHWYAVMLWLAMKSLEGNDLAWQALEALRGMDK